MNVNEAQEQWDSINAKLKQLTEEYRSGERWQDETKRMFWEIAEIQDDRQELEIIKNSFSDIESAILTKIKRQKKTNHEFF